MPEQFANFVTPHCHSSASLDTASKPETFAAWEAEHGTGAVTVTDHGTLGGIRKVYDICAKEYKGELHCIPGLEAYVRDDDCPILLGAGIQKNPDGKLIDYQKYFHLTLHFLDQPSYEVAVRLLSRADARAERHGKERKPLFGWADLEELGGANVTFGSSCLIGVVQRHLAFGGRPDIAEAYYRRLRSIAKPGNWYVEVFPHVCAKNWDAAVFLDFADGGAPERFPVWKKLRVSSRDGDGVKAEWLARTWRAGERGDLVSVMENRKWAERPPRTVVGVRYTEDFLQNECTAFAPDGDLQAPCNRWLLDMAAKCGDPVLVSDDSHFVTPDEKVVQDIKLQQSGSWRFATSYHRLTSEEAWEYFDRVLGTPRADFERWIDNSRAWSDRFRGLKFTPRRSLPTSFYPRETLDHTLALIERHGRMDWENPAWVARLRREVDLLHGNGTIDLLPYFFIDEEVCRLYENAGLLTGPGRGSAAGLLLTYLLGITHVDPLEYGLSVERFITPDRIQSGKMPDIDQDLPHRDLLVSDDVDFDDDEEEEHEEPAGVGDGECLYVDLDRSQDLTGGWLTERFGPCCVRVSTDISMKLRASVLDVMRYLAPDHVVPKEVARLTSKFAKPPQNVSDHDFVFGYADGDNRVDGSILSDEALITFTKSYPAEWEIVQKCLGIAKTRGQHPCAFAISDEPISDFIPTTSIGGVTVTQPTAEQVEAWGALKMDFLVIKNLLFIQDAVKLVQLRRGGDAQDWAAPGRFAGRFAADGAFRRRAMAGEEHAPSIQIAGKRVPLIRVVPHQGGVYDIWDLPEDQAVFQMICAGDTESVFQFRTDGARDWLRHFDRVRQTDPDGTVHKALDSIEGLAAFTALDRPGPLKYFVQGPDGKPHNMLVEYARRARGEGAVGNFPILDQLFPETFGVIVYQEQVQKAFHEVGQTTALQANDFRIHVAKKQPMEIIKDRGIFMPGATERVGVEAATQLFDSMKTFGEYGFNKSVAIETQLVTVDGNAKPIHEFRSGDAVWGVGDRGERVPVSVVAVHDHGVLPGFEVEFDDGYKLVCSASHKFLTASGMRPLWYVAALGVGVLADPADLGAVVFPTLETPEGVPGVRRGAGDARPTADEVLDDALWYACREPDGADRAPASLHSMRRGEGDAHRGAHGEVEPGQPRTGAPGDLLGDGEADLGAAGHPAPARSQDARVAEGASEGDGQHPRQGAARVEALEGGGVAPVQRDADLGRRTDHLRERAQASGLRLGCGLGGGGRVLPLLRNEGAEQTAGGGPDPRRDAERGGTAPRGDADPPLRRELPEFGRPDEAGGAGVAPSDAPLADSGRLLPRRIVRVRPVGPRRMCDLEVDHPRHNFLLPNGVVTSNSHAVCYVTVSYACAFLKHHYPLEWWCAVLRNAKKKDVEEKYWRHCGHLVDMPDIGLSDVNYEIVGERVLAPLTLIRGIGDKARDELCSHRPAASLRELLAKVEARRDAESKTVPGKTDPSDPSKAVADRVVRGRSALTSATFEAMILAGAMDGFFPAGADVLEKLQEYVRVESEVTGNVYKKTGAPKRKVPEKYLALGPLERFQLRKHLLPQARGDLFAAALPLLSDAAGSLAAFGGHLSSSVVDLADGSRFLQWNWNHAKSKKSYGVVKAAGIRHFGSIPVIRGGDPLRVAAVAYVSDFERKVSYNTDVPRERGVAVLDVDGELFNFVMWPPRGADNLPDSVPRDLDGAVVVALLSRWSTERPFAIDDLVILRGPFAGATKKKKKGSKNG